MPVIPQPLEDTRLTKTLPKAALSVPLEQCSRCDSQRCDSQCCDSQCWDSQCCDSQCCDSQWYESQATPISGPLASQETCSCEMPSRETCSCETPSRATPTRATPTGATPTGATPYWCDPCRCEPYRCDPYRCDPYWCNLYLKVSVEMESWVEIKQGTDIMSKNWHIVYWCWYGKLFRTGTLNNAFILILRQVFCHRMIWDDAPCETLYLASVMVEWPCRQSLINNTNRTRNILQKCTWHSSLPNSTNW